MVIQLVILYIVILVSFAIFLITRASLRNLRDGDGEITRWEKFLYGINLAGFITTISNTLFFILISMVSFKISRYDDFINDVFSSTGTFLNSQYDVVSDYWLFHEL